MPYRARIMYSIDGNRLARLRIKAGLNRGQLAELSGKSRSTISRLEAGLRGASPATLIDISTALRCEIEDFASFTEAAS